MLAVTQGGALPFRHSESPALAEAPRTAPTHKRARPSTTQLPATPGNKQAQTGSAAPTPAANFELTLAVALAGAAFEAYLEPTGGEGFQQLSLNGAKTTYTDR